jgi:uncharacterized protein (TIGR03435 family)
MTMTTHASLLIIALAARPSVLGAQTPTNSAPSFEVVSIKVSKGVDAGLHRGLQPGGRFTIDGITLRELIGFAYPADGGRPRNGSEISGGPAWLDADQFDIDARAAGLGAENSNAAVGAASQEDLQAINVVRLMVRSLLADRFHVAVHEETRQLPSYSLMLVKAGVLGPQLHQTSVSCTRQSTDGCGGFQMLGPGKRRGHVVTMKMVAGMISGELAAESAGDSRPVIDATNITGNVDVEFSWTPEPTGPSLFTAIQEQLGLKLVGSRAPVQVLIVDRADHPTEN